MLDWLPWTSSSELSPFPTMIPETGRTLAISAMVVVFLGKVVIGTRMVIEVLGIAGS